MNLQLGASLNSKIRQKEKEIRQKEKEMALGVPGKRKYILPPSNRV